MTLYKIVNTDNGLFSTGGTYPRWTKVGKSWTNIGHVKNHLRCWLRRWKKQQLPSNWELVVFDLSYAGSMPANEVIKEDT